MQRNLSPMSPFLRRNRTFQPPYCWEKAFLLLAKAKRLLASARSQHEADRRCSRAEPIPCRNTLAVAPMNRVGTSLRLAYIVTIVPSYRNPQLNGPNSIRWLDLTDRDAVEVDTIKVCGYPGLLSEANTCV
jgi:hypothetical protein